MRSDVTSLCRGVLALQLLTMRPKVSSLYSQTLHFNIWKMRIIIMPASWDNVWKALYTGQATNVVPTKWQLSVIVGCLVYEMGARVLWLSITSHHSWGWIREMLASQSVSVTKFKVIQMTSSPETNENRETSPKSKGRQYFEKCCYLLAWLCFSLLAKPKRFSPATGMIPFLISECVLYKFVLVIFLSIYCVGKEHLLHTKC